MYINKSTPRGVLGEFTCNIGCISKEKENPAVELFNFNIYPYAFSTEQAKSKYIQVKK